MQSALAKGYDGRWYGCRQSCYHHTPLPKLGRRPYGQFGLAYLCHNALAPAAAIAVSATQGVVRERPLSQKL
jgi:hypothetical protein